MNTVLHISTRFISRMLGRGARVENRVRNLLFPHISMTGRSLREQMRPGVKYFTLAGFYGDMARLEDEGVVLGWYETVETPGGAVRQRWYTLA